MQIDEQDSLVLYDIIDCLYYFVVQLILNIGVDSVAFPLHRVADAVLNCKQSE